MPDHPKTLGIDFDAVVHQYTGWDGDIPTGKPVIGAKEALLRLKSEGYELVCFTTRKSALVLQWLSDNDMLGIFSDVTNEKRLFWLIVDDRVVLFKGNWDKALERIHDFQVYWEKDKTKEKP